MTLTKKGSLICPSTPTDYLPWSSSDLRMAAVDLDGTLLGSDKQISSENARAVTTLTEHGYLVILTTGRVLQHALPYYHQLRLTGPLVTADGALVRIPNGTLIRDTPLSKDAVSYVLRAARSSNITAICFRRDGIRVSSKFDWNDDMDRHRRELPNHFGHSSLNALERSRVHKVLLLAAPATLEYFEEGLPQSIFQASSLIRNPNTLEFTATGVDKVSGLTYLGKANQVTFFGDGNNDIGALQWAHQSVAMHHGTEAAKMAAKLVAPIGSPDTNFAQAVQMIISRNCN